MKSILSIAIASLFLSGCEFVIKSEQTIYFPPKVESDTSIAVCSAGAHQINGQYVSSALSSSGIKTAENFADIYDTYTYCITEMTKNSNFNIENYDIFSACGGGKYLSEGKMRTYFEVRMKEESWEKVEDKVRNAYSDCLSTSIEHMYDKTKPKTKTKTNTKPGIEVSTDWKHKTGTILLASETQDITEQIW